MYLSQVLKDFSVENLKITSSTFLSKFSSEIYLFRIINYWGGIFTLYLTWGAFSLACVLSCFSRIFFLSFFFFFFLFLSVFSLQDSNDLRDSREGRGNHYFSYFPIPSSYSFSLSRFLPLSFNRSICNYQTDSWWDLFCLDILYFICIFIDAIKLELLTFIFHSDIVRIRAQIKVSPFYCRVNGKTN